MAQSYQGPAITPPQGEELDGSKFKEFIEEFYEFKNNSDYPYNKRLFITLCRPVSASAVGFAGDNGGYDPPGYSGSAFIEPIRTLVSGSYGEEPLRTNNLAELSTFEAVGFNEYRSNAMNNVGLYYGAFVPGSKTELKQQYSNKVTGAHSNEASLPNYTSGSYMLSVCTDDNPSLLVELNKDQQMPDGLGEKEFVILPENIHPFIKDNLEYFLTRGGVNVSGDASSLIKLNENNRLLK
jgi:hypothetical protein